MKKTPTKLPCLVALLTVSVAAAMHAQTTPRMDPIALKNWRVPSIDTMFKAYGNDPIGNTHFVNPGAFVFQSTIPCRVVDTRGAAGPYGGPIFAVGQTRSFSFASTTPTCSSSFPSFIAAVSVNITVTQTAGTGFVTGYATGGTLPSVSTVNWIGAGATVSNAAIVPTDGTANSSINIFASQSTHVIIDINGFFTANISANADTFNLVSNVSGGATLIGLNSSTAALSMGVFGSDGAGAASGATPSFSAGVVGHGRNGVIGRTSTAGGDAVAGAFENAGGTITALGILGFNTGGTDFGVYSFTGTVGCNGCTKQFVDPHPTDASKSIHYVSLEGNEAGTYFRGTATTNHGEAVISVPEDFRMVTDEEGLTVQLTPVGAAATMHVVTENLNQIVVRSSRDVTFHYLVQGIRPAYKNFQPIQDGNTYVPQSANQPMPPWNEWTRRRLIENGTYNQDGTVNLETAKRLGWDQVWQQGEASRQSTQPK